MPIIYIDLGDVCDSCHSYMVFVKCQNWCAVLSCGLHIFVSAKNRVRVHFASGVHV